MFCYVEKIDFLTDFFFDIRRCFVGPDVPDVVAAARIGLNCRFGGCRIKLIPTQQQQ